MANADLYRMQLQALLPQGAAWPRDPEAILTALLDTLAEELARVDGRALELIEEADPQTTLELLTEWERVAGLPDPCLQKADTLQERRMVLLAKLTNSGGQSIAFYLQVAESLGYSGTTIDESRPFVCGISRCGDKLNGGHSVRYVWHVNVPGPRVTTFRCGVSRCGEKLTNIDRAEDLECLLNRLKPAHSHLIFNYQGV